MGGEERCVTHVQRLTEGLPPRGRGRAKIRNFALVRCGITPAWAGKSLIRRKLGLNHRDYPRVGGEEVFAENAEARAEGLPPRGRGRGHRLNAVFASSRITPAWAGKSRSSSP